MTLVTTARSQEMSHLCQVLRYGELKPTLYKTSVSTQSLHLGELEPT
jgi:hypothetical protein